MPSPSSSISTEAAAIKDAVKRLLKDQGQTYNSLAKHLAVSLPTVKRLLNQDDLSLERLLAICEFLGITLDDLLTAAKEPSEAISLPALSEAQEQFLAADARYFSFWNQLVNGRTTENIQREYQLSSRSVAKYVRELETQGLVETTSTGKVRAKKFRAKLRPGGALYARHIEGLTGGFRSYIAGKALDSSIAGRPNDPVLHIEVSDFGQTRETFREFLAERRESNERYGKRYGLERRLGKLKNAGILFRLEMYYYADADVPALDEFKPHLAGFTAITNLD